MILEEQFKSTLNTIIADYNHRGMSLGSLYYTLKDTFVDFEQAYNTYVQQETQKMIESGEIDPTTKYEFEEEPDQSSSELKMDKEV